MVYENLDPDVANWVLRLIQLELKLEFNYQDRLLRVSK